MNYTRWKDLRDSHQPPHCMDWRHVLMINAVLRNELPTTVVEFGCHRGFSTAAIIEALEEKPEIARADLYDPDAQPELVARHDPPRINVHREPSAAFKGLADTWIIDGDHWAGALADYAMARNGGAKIIIIHDTHSHYVMGGHDGSRNIGGLLQIEAKETFLDCRRRPGEFTERGLLVGWFYEPRAATLNVLNAIKEARLEVLLK